MLVGSLEIEPSAQLAANLVEIAPYTPMPVELPVAQPGLPPPFQIATSDLGQITASTLRIGATTFPNVTTPR